ncbi:MAG: GNAT family N-acetyltransferase [Undibacterium sp.]|nr:GNAT family N-acetyltransferase [Undibacterium sp.]MDO8654767.1 GNAT family N-acetyltransferase [Undibacterium sp.]
MSINFESPAQADVTKLIAELDVYQSGLYPPESHHALDLTTVAAEQMLFAVARDATGVAIGCGAVVLMPGYGELKRMYVRPGNRGLGVARKILLLLESTAKHAGCTLLKLETGPYQPEAIGLYELCGYARRAPFGSYSDDPLSVFMQKKLVG